MYNHTVYELITSANRATYEVNDSCRLFIKATRETKSLFGENRVIRRPQSLIIAQTSNVTINKLLYSSSNETSDIMECPKFHVESTGVLISDVITNVWRKLTCIVLCIVTEVTL